MRVLIGVFAAWACAWAIVVLHAPDLALVAGLGFLQNLAFTFVSRGRNSGSLGYHMVASVFSNGIWVTMFVIGIKITTAPDADVLPFAFVYCLSTMAGSVFAHWLARKVERGKARNVQEDRVEKIEERLAAAELNHGEVRFQEEVNDRLGDLSKEVGSAKTGLVVLDEKFLHMIAEIETRTGAFVSLQAYGAARGRRVRGGPRRYLRPPRGADRAPREAPHDPERPRGYLRNRGRIARYAAPEPP
jgi:hypothetical protein